MQSVGVPSTAKPLRPELAGAQRPPRRQRMAGAALLLLRRDDPDIRGDLPGDLLQQLDARRFDPVIVRNQDPAFLRNRPFSHSPAR